MLEDSFLVLTAESGKNALRKYSNIHLKARLILLNMTLPDTTGPELILRMQEISRVPELIAYSDEENIQDAVDVMKNGANTYLCRPFRKDELIHVMERALEEFDLLKKLDQDSPSETLNPASIEKLISYSQSLRHKNTLPHGIVSNDFSIEQLKQLLEHSRTLHCTKDPKILVVEDEEMYRRTFQDFLSPMYTVSTAQTGQEALELASSQHFDIVLLDVFLPDVSGPDIMPQLFSHHPQVQIIIVTAFEFLDIAVNSLKSGACDYINKPFLKEQIMSAVHTALIRQFRLYSLPEKVDTFIQQSLSEDAKLELLYALSKRRTINNNWLCMRDVYIFFPELRHTCVPEASPIPHPLISQNGIRHFIDDLRAKMQQLNPSAPAL